MRITVDEEGRVTPEGAAQFLAAVGEFENVEGRRVSDTMAIRTFECAHCHEVIEAPAGQTTLHECETD